MRTGNSKERINEEGLDLPNYNVLWNVCYKNGRSLDMLDNGERLISKDDTHVSIYRDCEKAVFYFMSKSDPETEESILAGEEERLLSQDYERFNCSKSVPNQKKLAPEVAPTSLRLIKNLTKSRPSHIQRMTKQKSR